MSLYVKFCIEIFYFALKYYYCHQTPFILHKDLPIQSQDSIVVKHYPNSFRETNLHQLLQSKNITNLTICGAMTHMCIDTTVRAAFDLGYKITLASNACATKDLNYNGEIIEAKYVQASFLAALNGTFCEVV